MKICTKCQIAQPEDMFYHRSDNKNKRHASCKTCMQKSNTKWQQDNRKRPHGTRYRITDETIVELTQLFEDVTGCTFRPTDIDIAIRILLRK